MTVSIDRRSASTGIPDLCWNFETAESPEIVEALAKFDPHMPVCVLKSHAESARLLAIPETKY